MSENPFTEVSLGNLFGVPLRGPAFIRGFYGPLNPPPFFDAARELIAAAFAEFAPLVRIWTDGEYIAGEFMGPLPSNKSWPTVEQ